MKPYDDENCKCYEIQSEINKQFPKSDWNCDAACDAWRERSTELEDNNIEFEPHSDKSYSCTCPTCGRVICEWCV